MRRIKLFFFILLTLLICGNFYNLVISPAKEKNTGNVYYVSPSGKDSNPGTSSLPWRMVGYASKKLKPGDTLIVKSGTYKLKEYYDDMITPPSGKPGSWITIKGEDAEKMPIIKGKSNLLAAVDISGKSYIKLENLEITGEIDAPYTGGLREGIESGGSSDPGKGTVSHIEIKNVKIHHVEETGINFAGNINDVKIERVHIHNTGMTAIGSPGAAGGKGWKNVMISGCILEHAGLFYQGKTKRSPYDRPDGFGIEESEGPVKIINTISRFNYGDGLDSKSKNTLIQNCIIANNFGDGVKLWGGGSRIENSLIYGTGYPDPKEISPWCLIVIQTDYPGAKIEIINCTLFDDEKRANAHYSMTVNYDKNVPLTLVMKNNIIAGLSRLIFAGDVRLVAQNNLFYNRIDSDEIQVEIMGGKTYKSDDISSLGLGNMYGNPQFVRAEWGENGDFHLKDTSPAIDRGTSEGAPSIDLEGKKRPNGGSFDIGAYEK